MVKTFNFFENSNKKNRFFKVDKKKPSNLVKIEKESQKINQ